MSLAGGSHFADVAQDHEGSLPGSTFLGKLLTRLDAFGITRIADVTGLDFIGIPVVQAIRPLSLSNCVSQGKGEDVVQACISAILEAAETYFAERVDRFDVSVASAHQMAIPSDWFKSHTIACAGSDWQDAKTTWVTGKDLFSGEPQYVPFELVHTAYVETASSPDVTFLGSTSGLAVGSRSDDAIMHGLLECIERDAIARAHRTHGFFHKYRLDLAASENAELSRLLELIATAGLLVGAWLAPSPTHLPVVWCHLMEDQRQGGSVMPYPADGSAAAFDPSVAAYRAIVEAAQSRITAISGSRDDITWDTYSAYPDRRILESHSALLAEGPRPIDIATVSRGLPDTQARSQLPRLLESLSNSGQGPALAVSIPSDPMDDLHAVRIVCPNLLPLNV